MATARYLSGFGSIVDWRPLQFVEHLPDIRICGLCGVVARMTMLLPCSHILCQTCYRLVLDTNLSCPVDKRKVGEDEVQTLELKGDQLDDRRVLCLNAQRGCTFMGKLVDFKEHIEKDCKYHEVFCPKCGMSVSQSKILEHCLSSCVEGTIVTTPNESGSVLEDLRRIKQNVEDGMAGITRKKSVVQDKVNGLVECLDSFTMHMKSLQVVLHESIATSQLAKVHLPSAADSEGRGGSPGESGTVDRVYVCLGQIYKRKSSLCTGMTARELTPAFNLAGYSTMLESKFEIIDGHISLALGVVFCSGGWDSFVTWPFSRQMTLTLVHPVDKQKNLSYQASVPQDVDRFECVKKPSPEGPNSAMRTRMITWNALELSGFIANDSLCLTVEFE
ncbi:uncharacterized protein LOC144095387 [Amblyomma americanum]